MKEITKEQINEVMAKVANTKDINQILLNNIESYNNLDNDDIKPYSLYLVTMSTAVQISLSIIKESLYELLTDK